MTTLPMAIPGGEISAIRVFAVCCGWTIPVHTTASVWRIEWHAPL